MEERLFKATQIFNKRSDISEVSSKISNDVGESLSKQQKEFFLRQQLNAIQKELARLKASKSPSSATSGTTPGTSTPMKGGDGKKGPNADLDDEQDDEGDYLELRKKIELMAHGSEERKMAAREWKRLKRIPAGSVENGVIRNYVRFSLSISLRGFLRAV